jgi:tetratricopeptide (TPR) repeat protein
LHHAALQHKALGRFDDARALWNRVAGESLDAALTLRAQLEIAACTFFDDLAASKAALESVRAQLGAVTDAVQHRQLHARVLAGLVDNRVFAGDLAAARADAALLVPLLPGLPPTEQAEALEVLIELAMREPDIAAAWHHLGALRSVAPQRPSVLSFEGQIHWFSGNVRAAGEALRRLLERFPEHRRGLTIENDLAVMLHALGELAEAESMARSSLLSWCGVAHTETLSLLVLGLVLTSQGRHDEADARLRRALVLAREQSSSGFEAEAQVRLARLALQCGRIADARASLDAAAPLLRGSPEPLRVSQWAWAEVMVASAAGVSVDPAVLDSLADVASRSVHPLVQARVARVRAELALRAGDALAAREAARQQAAVARQAGLLEPLAEALLLEACIGLRSAGQSVAEGLALAHEAEAIARAQGLVELQWRASSWLAVQGGVRGAATRARAALRQLRGPGRAGLFDAAVAARREPQVRSD